MAAEDNNVGLEQIELLGQLADKQEEMRSKRIAFTTVEQTMFNSIMQLPPAGQVTTLRGFIPRMERKLSKMSVQTVPAAQKETTSASCNVAGACAAVAAAPATYPSSRGSSDPKRRRMQHRSEDSEHPENVGAAGAPHGSGTFDSPDSLSFRTIRPPRDSLPVRGMSQVQRQQTEHFNIVESMVPALRLPMPIILNLPRNRQNFWFSASSLRHHPTAPTL